MRKRDREALASSYKLATYEVNSARDQAVAEAHAEIASGRASVNPGIATARIVDAMKVAIERAVNTLIADHIRSGDDDGPSITDRIRSFVESQVSGSFPSSPSRNPGLEMRHQAMAQASYAGTRGAIASRVHDLVETALLKRRAETTQVQRIQRWASNNRPLAVVIVAVVVIAALRAAGLRFEAAADLAVTLVRRVRAAIPP